MQTSKQNNNATNSKKIMSNQRQQLLTRLAKLKGQMQKTLIIEQNHTGTLRPRQHRKSQEYAETKQTQDYQKMSKIDEIRLNIVGFNTTYMTPFNIQIETVYVDHTATNRPYKKIEQMIQYAKKFSANPHTQFSHFGKYSTQMMHYAQESLLKSFSADPKQFVALPTGSGSTGAIQKATKILKLLEQPNSKPVIYITPYQHHSNILPWVQFWDNVKLLASDQHGNLLMKQIKQQLINEQSKNIIVSASAASNVTSKLTDLTALNNVIKNAKKNKQIIFAVDCAAFCCHDQLNLIKYDQIDFAYLSPHKNLGGAQSCGVLIARKQIIKNAKPTFPGGGTVAFVKGYSKGDVMYDGDIFNREIAGTPPFFGYYRAALSFELLKNDITYTFIHRRQKQNTNRFIELINEANKRFLQKGLKDSVNIYGDADFDKRANVITFNMFCKGQIIHHHLASLILADVFGIQLRSGCFCAGPFGMQLLQLDKITADAIQQQVSVGILRDKPGYLRLDLTFYLQLFQIEYVAKAIICLAQYAKNMNLIYTLCNNGQIIRNPSFQSVVNDKYSLSNFNFAYEQNKKQLESCSEKLQKRKETLEKQLQRGLNIVKNPIQFLKSLKNKS